MKKLESLYDFQQLGIRALRRPELNKIDKLESAKKNKQCIILENYKSNSNKTGDRLVECFHINHEAGMIQVFDIEEQKTKHFKLNRIERVKILEQAWKYESKHHSKYTDVFRIANDHRVMVHLQFDLYAYNALADSFPQALGAILPGAIPNTFDFQTKVNADFWGLTNFIMGNAGHVEIINPPELKEAIRKKVEEVLKKL